MAELQKRFHCPDCERKMMFVKQQSISTGAGLILSLFTLGLFVPLWLLMGLATVLTKWRCRDCGYGKVR